jgi:hypothetical protein
VEITLLKWRRHPPTAHGEIANEPCKKEGNEHRRSENDQIKRRQRSLRIQGLVRCRQANRPLRANGLADFERKAKEPKPFVMAGSRHYSNSEGKVPICFSIRPRESQPNSTWEKLDKTEHSGGSESLYQADSVCVHASYGLAGG